MIASGCRVAAVGAELPRCAFSVPSSTLARNTSSPVPMRPGRADQDVAGADAEQLGGLLGGLVRRLEAEASR